ncbi:MAG: hypothetical protein N3E51_03375 [Candidatus Micrarchaeota archaeon]|nr:hypothetical protein [Candidatus Micrarchaeota archaeon]
MACFLVPTIVGIGVHSQRKRFPLWAHVEWLSAMVLGGAVALAVEHYAHGEIVPWPPFLTAMGSPADTAAMLSEMVAVGLPMTAALIVAWGALVYIYNRTDVPRRLGVGAAAGAPG